MPVFDFTFTVRAPLQVVADFHRDSRTLKRLTPPPVFVQIHSMEPLAEGSRSEFSMWFGHVPLRWMALHSYVHGLRGFTDTHESGPLQTWQHTHRFEAIDTHSSRVSEHIVYSHKTGWRGLLTRLLFAPIGLRFMFTYRARVTRRACER
jgi:ligand-binding SRPBCC domain-containing protein